MLNTYNNYCELIRNGNVGELLVQEISSVIDDFFVWCCESGFQSVAEWVYNLSRDNPNKRIDLNVGSEYVFRISCGKGRKEMAQWLYDISKIDGNTKIDINALDEFPFREACKNNYLDVAKWLYDLSKTDYNEKIDVRVHDDSIFVESCENNQKDVAEWLCSICNDYEISYEGDKMVAVVWNIRIILKHTDPADLDGIYNCCEIKNVNEDCMICFDSENRYRVKLNCSHEVCSACFIQITRCPCRCKKGIDLDEIKLIKIVP
jgi:hypothetical protein